METGKTAQNSGFDLESAVLTAIHDFEDKLKHAMGSEEYKVEPPEFKIGTPEEYRDAVDRHNGLLGSFETILKKQYMLAGEIPFIEGSEGREEDKERLRGAKNRFVKDVLEEYKLERLKHEEKDASRICSAEELEDKLSQLYRLVHSFGNYQNEVEILSIRRDSSHDPLVREVYNRRHFSNELEKEVKKAQKALNNQRALLSMDINDSNAQARIKRNIEDSYMNLLFIDIDHFKGINDIYGHGFGDDVLKEFGKYLRKNCKDYDLVGRHGGEEFCVALSSTSRDNADNVAKRLVKNIEELNSALKERFPDLKDEITISVGISTYDWDSQNTEELMDHADKAMYHVKNNGRNGWHRYDQTNTKQYLKGAERHEQR